MLGRDLEQHKLRLARPLREPAAPGGLPHFFDEGPVLHQLGPARNRDVRGVLEEGDAAAAVVPHVVDFVGIERGGEPQRAVGIVPLQLHRPRAQVAVASNGGEEGDLHLRQHLAQLGQLAVHGPRVAIGPVAREGLSTERWAL